MKRMCSLVLISAILLPVTSCAGAYDQQSQESSTTSIETEITESTPETTAYTDETAVIVAYEPVDFLVLEDDVDFIDMYYDYSWAEDFEDDYWTDPVRYIPDDFDYPEEADIIYEVEFSYPTLAMDWNQYYFGLEDPALVNFLRYLYELHYEPITGSAPVTIDTFAYLNDYSCEYQPGVADYDVNARFFTFNQESMDVIASQDHRLDRAVMVALGRKYFVQEIPYSFFATNFLNDTEYIIDDDWHLYETQYIPYVEEGFTLEELTEAFLTTLHYDSFVSSTSDLETGEDLANRGYWSEGDPIRFLESGNVYVSDPFDSLTQPVFAGEVNVQNRDFYHNYYQFAFTSPDDEWGWDYEFDSLDLYNYLYENLPAETVACLTCVRYNRQFSVSSRFCGERPVLYRDMDNGAITMDLNGTRMGYVVQAFENAGYPLQTDDEGNIVAESPAHFREVYGEEYTDVLAEYGLEV